MFSVGAFVEEDVNYIKGHGPTADNHASGHGTPERIGSRKLPDRQQRGDYRHQNAGAGCPKGNRSNSVRIEIASSLSAS